MVLEKPHVRFFADVRFEAYLTGRDRSYNHFTKGVLSRAEAAPYKISIKDQSVASVLRLLNRSKT